MSLDVEQHDVLLVDEVMYPISITAHWPKNRFGAAWAQRLTLDATILRAPYTGAGWQEYAAWLTDLKCSPLYPLQAEVQLEMPLDQGRQVLRAYVKSADDDEVLELVVQALQT